jgi:glycosyltransferase involved in cell wall biosynthesis
MKNLDLCVVMPVYNEEGAIGNVIDKWTDALNDLGCTFEIHAYNDGSKDNTLSTLREISRGNAHLVVHDKLNTGHGPTIIQGYRASTDAEWVFQIDSDDEIGPESFHDLWKNRDKYAFLIGQRCRARQPLSRQLVSLISRLTVHLFYGNRVHDVNSPYRLMKTDIFKNIFLSLPNDTFAPNVIISGTVSLKNMNCYEIPVQQRERATGEVSIKKWKLLKAALKSLSQTVMYRFRVRKNDI